MRRSNIARGLFYGAMVVACWMAAVLGSTALSSGAEILDHMAYFASLEDRSVGSEGADAAADYILKAFSEAGLEQVGAQEFLIPVPQVISASLEVDGRQLELYPWGPNLVYLPMTPPGGLQGPLVYAANGDFKDFNHHNIKGSIVLMDMASSGNWMNAAMFGAGAIIFLGRQDSGRGEFELKNIPSPVAIPRFWISHEEGQALRELALKNSPRATVLAKTRWHNKTVRNCYGLLPGKHPELKKELIVLDAFYDASSQILGKAPGADESLSVSMLLELASKLARDPPDRSVLFLATGGYGQGMAGTRNFIWAVTARKKLLRKEYKELQERRQKVSRLLELLQKVDPLQQEAPQDREMVLRTLLDQAKDRADILTREIQYQRAYLKEELPAGLADPRPYRRLSWISGLAEITPDQKPLALELLSEALPRLKTEQKELKQRYQALKSAEALRSLQDEFNPVLYLSLHLSSHSPLLGVAEMGSTYPFRETVKRIMRAGRLVGIFSQLASQVSAERKLPNIFKETGRGSGKDEDTGKSHAPCCLCCDVGLLAGLPAVSLVTLEDNRPYWSTPHDTIERVNRENVVLFAGFLPSLLKRAFSQRNLPASVEPGMTGIASLEGQAKFIRQGELFPDQPAPGTIISVIQGDTVFRTMVYHDGTFFLPGLANKRVSLEKLILEPYGVDPSTGRIAWTADKVQTRKVNYRIKVKSDLASTSLVMFHCEQTDVYQIFNPQKMSYLTKVNLLDAATEATPLRYWYSRVDGRDTMAISIFLEKGTPFKLLMSESLMGKELLLLNNSQENTTGKGFMIGDPPALLAAPYQAAHDLRFLVEERLRNLFQHGIMNRYLETLYATSLKDIDEARNGLVAMEYDRFWDHAIAAWARLNSIYREIEGTQRDVLAGVMFFVALFVPFAYCMERYLFCFRNVYQQIIAFLSILVVTILTIRGLHPAFRLTYSPMVVILAFFIVGLSLLVSWIIFMRFEEEMANEQARTQHGTPQASKWKAFGAGFAIGVSNLNRRKLRTALTCITLIILTFTVMSFTNVKTLHKTMETRLAEDAPYEGILLRHPYRMPLTLVTLEDMQNRYGKDSRIWPKAWIEPQNSSDRILTKVQANGRYAPVEGILGLGQNVPAGFLKILTNGRWFENENESAVLLSTSMGSRLGLNPEKDLFKEVLLLGVGFKVVGFFDGSKLESLKDLDQQSLTPAYLEVSQSEELSEVELEAIQSGEEILPQTDRFRNASAEATIILPFERCIEFGGTLRSVSILPPEGISPLAVAADLSTWLAYPLFVGDKATWYQSASTTLRYQGVSNLIVPILIVIFITLNTMIGHVHERQKEIATYTSVGLAPTHVGFLFIVEALSLAAISSVIGYILAQLSAKFLGNTDLFSSLTFNYSSLASVACMFLVFSVVFLAALYPARLAAEIAMPDVNRSWTLPEPAGDIITLNLPFLLKSEEEGGIMRFLFEFYRAHQDMAHGSFIVDEAKMEMEIPDTGPGRTPAPLCLMLSMDTWLAPFDFGIKQHLQLYCCPSEDNPGYLEIALVMTRLSGERSAWVRANKNFIKALRKQMLVWRFLDVKSKQVYLHAESVTEGS